MQATWLRRHLRTENYQWVEFDPKGFFNLERGW
jgi:hypothetical protein